MPSTAPTRATTSTAGTARRSSSRHRFGLPVDQLKVKLATGQTLGQVGDATAGTSSTGLVDYLTGLVKTQLDKLVAANRITSTQESAFLDRVQAKLTRLVSINWTDRARMGWHH